MGTPTDSAVIAHDRWASHSRLVLVAFIAVQILDGVLTYWGMGRLGAGVAVNSYLSAAIGALGAAPVLFASKSVVCLGGSLLYLTARYRPLAIAAGGYLAIAILPWLIIVARS